jgi:hypothetical protein
MTEPNDPRYPIGRFERPETVSAEDLRFALQTLAEMPEQLREAVRGFDPEQEDTPYREGGWTVKQLVHHIADSHAAAMFRAKKALTEDWPEITPYSEAEFAKLADNAAPIEWSLDMIESVHARWVMLLQSLSEEQWKRGFRHPERGPQGLDVATMLYAWHAHINHLRTERGW